MTTTLDAPGRRATPRRPPAAPSWREPTFVLLFVAGVFADMVNGNAGYVGLPISPDRLLLGGAVVLVLADADLRAQVRLRWRIVHTLMLALLAWVFWSGLVAGTIFTTYGLYAWLDRLAVPFLAFTLAPMVFANPRRRDLLLKALTVMGVYLGLTAIFEVVGPTSLVFPRYIMNPDIGLHYGFARGPFLEAEADGLAMIACGLAAALLVARDRGRWRWAGVACVPLCAVGVVLAQERSTWIGLALAILVPSLFVRRLRRLLPAVVVGIAVLIGGVLALSPQARAGLKARTDSNANLSVFDRRNTDAAAIRVIEAKPLTGLGWVRFEAEGRDYVRLSPDYPITNVDIEVHNVYLSRAAETGVIGGALFVATLLAGPGRAAVRRWRPGLGESDHDTDTDTDDTDTDDTDDADDDRLGWHAVSTGFALAWLVCSMLSPVSYPLANLELWLFAGIVLAPWTSTTVPPRVSGSLTASGELATGTARRVA